MKRKKGNYNLILILIALISGLLLFSVLILTTNNQRKNKAAKLDNSAKLACRLDLTCKNDGYVRQIIDETNYRFSYCYPEKWTHPNYHPLSHWIMGENGEQGILFEYWNYDPLYNGKPFKVGYTKLSFNDRRDIEKSISNIDWSHLTGEPESFKLLFDDANYFKYRFSYEGYGGSIQETNDSFVKSSIYQNGYFEISTVYDLVNGKYVSPSIEEVADNIVGSIIECQ